MKMHSHRWVHSVQARSWIVAVAGNTRAATHTEAANPALVLTLLINTAKAVSSKGCRQHTYLDVPVLINQQVG